MTRKHWGLVLACLLLGVSLSGQEPQSSLNLRNIYIDEIDARDRPTIVLTPDLAADGLLAISLIYLQWANELRLRAVHAMVASKRDRPTVDALTTLASRTARCGAAYTPVWGAFGDQLEVALARFLLCCDADELPDRSKGLVEHGRKLWGVHSGMWTGYSPIAGGGSSELLALESWARVESANGRGVVGEVLWGGLALRPDMELAKALLATCRKPVTCNVTRQRAALMVHPMTFTNCVMELEGTVAQWRSLQRAAESLATIVAAMNGGKELPKRVSYNAGEMGLRQGCLTWVQRASRALRVVADAAQRDEGIPEAVRSGVAPLFLCPVCLDEFLSPDATVAIAAERSQLPDSVRVAFSREAVRGNGTVQGIVRGQDGEPMRNVEVFAEDQYLGGKELARSRTDGNGMFVLGRLPVQQCYVFAKGAGTTTAVQPARLTADRRHVAVAMRVYEARTIRGRVVDGKGQPIAGALVMGTKEEDRWSGGLRRAEARSDADGQFELTGVPIGLCVFRVWKPGFVLRPFWLTSTGDDELKVKLWHKKQTELRITTEGLSKQAIAATRVWVTGARGFSGFALPSDLSSTSLDASGSLRIRGLPDADWTVSLSHPDLHITPREAKVNSGQRSAAMHFVASEAGRLVVRGTLVDTAGKPLAKQQLLSHPLVSGSSRTVTDDRGRFGMPVDLVDGEKIGFSLVGSDYVFCQEKGANQMGIHFPHLWSRWEGIMDSEGELRLVAERAAHVEAMLIDSARAPMQLVKAELQIQHYGRWRMLATATAGRDGRVRFPAVPATGGDCRIFVRSAGVGNVKPFQVQAGRVTFVSAAFPSPAVIKGQVLNPQGKPVAGVCVLVGDYATEAGEGGATMHSWIPTDREGRFVIPNIAGGRHLLIVEKASVSISDQFVVEPGKTIVVNLTTSK